jgi:hypothetical protein
MVLPSPVCVAVEKGGGSGVVEENEGVAMEKDNVAADKDGVAAEKD